MRRGEIRDMLIYTQPKDLSDLLYGKITGSDIDIIFDLKWKLWILIELKPASGLPAIVDGELNGRIFQTGQRVNFEHLQNDLNMARPAYYLVAEHKLPNINRCSSCGMGKLAPIAVSQCVVTAVRNADGWQEGGGKTVKEVIEILLKRHRLDWLIPKADAPVSSESPGAQHATVVGVRQ